MYSACVDICCVWCLLLSAGPSQSRRTAAADANYDDDDDDDDNWDSDGSFRD